MPAGAAAEEVAAAAAGAADEAAGVEVAAPAAPNILGAGVPAFAAALLAGVEPKRGLAGAALEAAVDVGVEEEDVAPPPNRLPPAGLPAAPPPKRLGVDEAVGAAAVLVAGAASWGLLPKSEVAVPEDDAAGWEAGVPPPPPNIPPEGAALSGFLANMPPLAVPSVLAWDVAGVRLAPPPKKDGVEPVGADAAG